MARRWLLVVVVGVVAVVLGAVVAGRPQDVSSDVISSRLPDVVATTSTTVRAAATTAATSSTRETGSAPETTATSSTTTTTTVAGPPSTMLLEMTDVRIVVANATNVSGLAARTIEELRPLGYTQLVAADAVEDRPETVIVHVDGRSGEALRLATQIGLDPGRVRPLQTAELTVSQDDGDVWLLVGADRV